MPASPTVICGNGRLPGFRRCATLPMPCSGSVSPSPLAVIYVVTNLRRDSRHRRARERGASDHARRQRRILIAVALLFFAPLGACVLSLLRPRRLAARRPREPRRVDRSAAAAACADAAHGRERPRRRRAGGRAVTARISSSTSGRSSTGARAAVRARCRTDLYNTRQVRIALNRDMDRVQRVFLAEGACCDLEFLRERASGSDHGAGNARGRAACSRCSSRSAGLSRPACRRPHLSHRSPRQSHDVVRSGRECQRHARRHEAAAGPVSRGLSDHARRTASCSGSDASRCSARCSPPAWSSSARGCG